MSGTKHVACVLGTYTQQVRHMSNEVLVPTPASTEIDGCSMSTSSHSASTTLAQLYVVQRVTPTRPTPTALRQLTGLCVVSQGTTAYTS